MSGVVRVLLLTIRHTRQSMVKFLLLAILTAVGMTVFLVVTELSRVSSEGLDDAISEDIGDTGTYRIGVSSDFGSSPRELASNVESAVAPFAVEPVTMVEVLPPVTAECPPYEALGPQQLLILSSVSGQPTPLPFGKALPVDTELCLDGLVIPAGAMYLPSSTEQAEWGIGIAIASSYRDVAALSSRDPITFSFTVVTGQIIDQREAILSALEQGLDSSARRYGIETEDVIQVQRVDTGNSIRKASDGIKLVYTLIGWGVMVLGGLALLVAELVAVLERTWFFGLARAIGARRSHIAALVFADIALVLGVGLILTILIGVLAQPSAAAFAMESFGIEIDLIQLSTVPHLTAGVLVVLALAAVYPALVAVRLDPLDVLEPKGS